MKFKSSKQRKAVMAKIKEMPLSRKPIHFDIVEKVGMKDKIHGQARIGYLPMNGYTVSIAVYRTRPYGINDSSTGLLKVRKSRAVVVKRPETAYKKFFENKKMVQKLVKAEPYHVKENVPT